MTGSFGPSHPCRERNVTDPKNPETKPEAPKPAPASSPYISSKLREKLMEGDDKEWTPSSSSPLPGIIGTIVIVGILAVTFMWWQSSTKKQEAAKAAAEAAAARADSIVTAARAESIATVARADSAARADSLLAHGGKRPKPAATASAPAAKSTPSAAKPATSAGTPGTPAAPAAPKAPPSDGFGIAVGQFMLEDRANSEKDKLAASTGLAGKVVPVDDGGTTVYRVILGKWSSRGPAEKKATDLIDSSYVHEARVVARPK